MARTIKEDDADVTVVVPGAQNIKNMQQFKISKWGRVKKKCWSGQSVRTGPWSMVHKGRLGE
jgi:hypothetical protein